MERFLEERSNFDLMEQSFVVSGGILYAHALYIYSLALHIGKSYEDINTNFADIAEEMDSRQVIEIFTRMSRFHKDNPNAKERAANIFRKFRNLESKYILSGQIASNNIYYELMLALEKKVKKPNLDRALLNAWQENDPDIITEKLKNISAALGLYKETNWWKKLPKEKKKEMKSDGKRLLQGTDSG